MPETMEPKALEFGKYASPGSWLLSNEAQINERDALVPYAHYLRQAWRELSLSGVLCVEGRPTVYLCEAQSFSADEKRTFQRFAWNQGLVPLLVFITPNSIEVHSAVKIPERVSGATALFDVQQQSSFISAIRHVADALEIGRFVRAVETGQYFGQYSTFFPAEEAVDRCLLNNLLHAARRLNKAGWDLSDAHALLGRALFISFLQERSFIKIDYFPSGAVSLLDILSRPRVDEAKRLLYREFFPRLKREFNGTMFDVTLADEERRTNKAHLDILASFLGRDDMKSGQMTLGFWAYDFRFIPVEIISAIYEDFMKEANPIRKRNEGAYYTPRHLAETAVHVALDGRARSVPNWRVLDPACGSGIFLVAIFNLLAEQWHRNNVTRRKQTKAQALLDILQNQIRGVDLNADACRIAAFSLYLALFEKLQPIDVEEFKEKVSEGPFLPPLVWTSSKQIPKPVIIQGDFIEDTLPLETDFDLVLGNPPWENRGRSQIALQFVRRSKNFLRAGGVGCLILPSALLVNRSGTLDGDWFRSVIVEKIVQLADFRRVLFAATHPCFILRYAQGVAGLDHAIAYETPKLNRFDRRQGVIVVEPEDQKYVLQRDVLSTSLDHRLQSLWSRKFWGTPRDETFLRRLDFYPPLSDLVGTRGSRKRWRASTGFQPHFDKRHYRGYEPVKNPWPLSDPFLDANAPGINLIVHDDQFTTVGRKLREIGASTSKVLFAREDATFRAPMLIYSKGFTKCAFSSHDVHFFDGLRSIAGSQADSDLLRFLVAIFRSQLFKYITFHSGSNFGVGRDQLHVYESLAFPFPLPDHELAAPKAASIVSSAAKVIRALERSSRNKSTSTRRGLIAEATVDLEPLVDAYFQVSSAERILIDDTLAISQPSIHRSDADDDVPSLRLPNSLARRQYADTFCDVLNSRARHNQLNVHAEGRVSESLSLILFTAVFAKGQRPYVEAAGDDALWNALERVRHQAGRYDGRFSYLRGFSFFEADRLHMLKPATTRNWSRTAALNDADAVFEHMARANA
jgi:SAM-dependent methyltransferase